MIKRLIEWLMKLFGAKEETTEVEPEKKPTASKKSAIDKNDWQVENTVSDAQNNCLKFTYREKYGAPITIYCMAVFRNDKENQYKLIAPWMGDHVVERSNITGKDVIEVTKKAAGKK